MFKTLPLFALALLLVAAAAVPIDVPGVASVVPSNALPAPSLETVELATQDEDLDDIDGDTDADDDGSVLNGLSPLGASRICELHVLPSGPRHSFADVSELTDNEEEFIKGKLYGKYCGVRYVFFAAHCFV